MLNDFAILKYMKVIAKPMLAPNHKIFRKEAITKWMKDAIQWNNAAF